MSENKSAPVAQPVATVSECEACFTPDVCQLRGTCDHYAAEQLRVARAAPAPVLTPAQAHADELLWSLKGAANYLDKLGGVSQSYRVLVNRVEATGKPAAPVLTPAQALSDEQIDKMLEAERMRWSSRNGPPTYEFALAFARAIERAHGITTKATGQEYNNGKVPRL